MPIANVKGNYLKLSEKQMKTADIVGQVVDIGGQIASGIISAQGAAKNQRLQDEINNELQKLDAEQMKVLGSRLTLYSDADAKLGEMMRFFAEKNAMGSSQYLSSTIRNKYMGKADKQRKTMYYAFGGALVFIIIIAIVKKLKK